MIEGQWFGKGGAAHSDAALLLDGDNFQLTTAEGVAKEGKCSDIEISDRLGNVPRKLTFDDGSVFSTKDNDAIDKLLVSSRKSAFLINKHLIHKVESKLSFAFVALLVTIAVSFSFVKWGIPTISHAIAEALPQKTNDLIGANTLRFLDEHFFEESSLKQARQDAIRQHFETTLLSSYQRDENINFTLHFREWSMAGESIPNALALPSGEIVLTDKFVELSESQEEIDAVLLHEIGHIVHRHSLKMVIKGAIVTAVVMMVTGDTNGVVDMGIGLGSLLMSAAYSRDFESEADQFAFDKMLEAGIDPIAFSTIMDRITSYSEGESSSEPENEDRPDSATNDYFSTHPNTDKRTEKAKFYSQCFKQGLRGQGQCVYDKG